MTQIPLHHLPIHALFSLQLRYVQKHPFVMHGFCLREHLLFDIAWCITCFPQLLAQLARTLDNSEDWLPAALLAYLL